MFKDIKKLAFAGEFFCCARDKGLFLENLAGAFYRATRMSPRTESPAPFSHARQFFAKHSLASRRTI
jgi:hypothetical protein